MPPSPSKDTARQEVTLTLEVEEVDILLRRCLLRGKMDDNCGPGCRLCAVEKKLQAAFENPAEPRTEYRVVGDGWVSACAIDGRAAAEVDLAIVEGKGVPNARLEYHTITTLVSDWTDLPEEEQ